MKSKFILLRLVILPVFFLALLNKTNAQAWKDSQEGQELYKEIARMDSILFDAFNNQNLEKFKTLFDADLEFYHDISGLTGYEKNMEMFKSTIEKNNGLRRELVKGSLEVYPVKDFGAIQIGSHQFCHPENGKQDCGVFKFVHIWQKKDGQWKITRVISYGH